MLPLLMHSQKDTTKIELPIETARLVLKDLVEKDYLEKQVVNLELQLNTQSEIIQNKEHETDNLNGQIETYESLVKSKDSRLSNSDKIISNLEDDLSRKKAGNTFWKITTGLALVFGIVMSIK